MGGRAERRVLLGLIHELREDLDELKLQDEFQEEEAQQHHSETPFLDVFTFTGAGGATEVVEYSGQNSQDADVVIIMGITDPDKLVLAFKAVVDEDGYAGDILKSNGAQQDIVISFNGDGTITVGDDSDNAGVCSLTANGEDFVGISFED